MECAAEFRAEECFRVLIPLVLASGAVGMLLLDRFFRGDVLGYGFPNFLEQVNLGNARIKRGWIFVKAAGAALSLGSGWSVGREGPIAQVGGAIGSAVAQFRKLGPERAKVLVAAGAGAGIATTFNAPMGGLMFAQEIVLLGHTELANLTLLIVATLTAVVTSRAVTGNDAVFQVPQFVLRSYWEMLTYGAMGAAVRRAGRGLHPLLSCDRRQVSPPRNSRLAEARDRRGDRRRGGDFSSAESVRRLSHHQRGDGRASTNSRCWRR